MCSVEATKCGHWVAGGTCKNVMHEKALVGAYWYKFKRNSTLTQQLITADLVACENAPLLAAFFL